MPAQKSAPALLIRLPLEQAAEVSLDAQSFEDEQRLRLWLRRSGVLVRLPGLVEELLDNLGAQGGDR